MGERALDLMASRARSDTVAHMARTVTHVLERSALDAAMARWVREHEGVIHQRRMEHLGEQAAGSRGVAVQHSTSGFCGDRMSLVLGDGTAIRLHLLWPRRHAIAAILGVRWTDRIGWTVTARTTAGDSIPIHAWRARVLLPRRRTGADAAGWSLLG